MELIYLWVEKFKNIEKQGFNFSPKFRCEYNPDTNELTIEEKDYIPIFPDNINITAIVGKNGSGKSSLLTSVLKLIISKKGNKNNKIIIINNNKLQLLYFDKNIKIINKTNLILEKIENLNGIYPLFIDFSLANAPITHEKNEKYKKNYAIEPSRFYDSSNPGGKLEPSSFDSNLKSNVLYFYWSLNKIKEEKIFLLSNLNIPEFVNIKKIRLSNLNKNNKIAALAILLKQKEKIKSIKINIDSENFIQNFRKSLNEDFCFDFDAIKIDIKKNFENIFEKINKSKEEIEIELSDFIDGVKKLLKNKCDKKENKENKHFDIEQFIIKKLVENILKIDELQINKLQDVELPYFEYIFRLYKFEFVSMNNLSFNQLSTGQKIMLSYFGIFVKYYIHKFNKNKNNKVIVLIDEIETSFHPEWQRKLLYYLITFINKTDLKNFYNHFIIATHSPFIISDLPKENIIFLDKDENGKCIVVDGLNEKKETFGANIHTLLSDSFFMEDGLIGEFAKSKIDDVIKYLNDVKSEIKTEKEAQRIINIIGEPIIKKELQRILDSKRLEKINNIDEKIKQLEYELEILKKYQSQNIKNELIDRGKKEYFLKKKDEKNNNN